MKIVYLARRPIPSVNAHSVQIVKMSEAFGKLGHDVLLLTHRGDDEARHVYGRYGVDEAFAIESFPTRSRSLLPKWRFGAFMLRHPRVRAADLFFGRDIFSLTVAARLGKPVIFEAHCIPPKGTLRWRLLERLFASKNFSHLVCVTTTLADTYRFSFKSLASKTIVVVPNGAADFQASPELGAWPGRLGATQVGFVGRPFAGKGIELMVAAAGRLPECDFSHRRGRRKRHRLGRGRLPAEPAFSRLPAALEARSISPSLRHRGRALWRASHELEPAGKRGDHFAAEAA